MIDLRYHIYSLVAVFLALALGIAVGACVVSPGKSDGQEISRRQAQIRQLEQRFDALQKEITRKQVAVVDAQAKLEQTEQFSKAILPAAVKGKLAYRNVAIIQTTGDDEAVAAVRTAVEQAGGEVSTHVQITPALSPDSESLADAMSALEIDPATGQEQRMEAILSIIVDGVVWGRGSGKVSTLKDHDLINTSSSMRSWNKLIVIVGGADSADKNCASYLDAPLAGLFKERGATVVGCETVGSRISYMAAFAGKGVATVDNIDKAAGQLGLIFALCGEHGHYGVKKTADRLIPRTLGQVTN